MLTDAQMTDVRRYAGYAAVGTTMPINANSDVVFVHYGMVWMPLITRLTTFSATEEAVMTSVYLAKLPTLESAIWASADNLDTDAAAVWTHNKNEVRDRTALFNQCRVAMCAFIGLKPGDGLPCGGRIVRA